LGKCKKKVDTELGTYFPGWFGDDIEYLDNLRQYYLLKAELEFEYNDKDAALLNTICDYFLKRHLPMCFNPYDENSVLISGEKDFEDMCYSMEDSGVKNVKESTVFEFYSKVQYLEKKVRRMKEATRQ
jgi:hypothetical protein